MPAILLFMFLVLTVKTSRGVGCIHGNAHTGQMLGGGGGKLPRHVGNKRPDEGVFSVSAILIITKLYNS